MHHIALCIYFSIALDSSSKNQALSHQIGQIEVVLVACHMRIPYLRLYCVRDLCAQVGPSIFCSELQLSCRHAHEAGEIEPVSFA